MTSATAQPGPDGSLEPSTTAARLLEAAAAAFAAKGFHATTTRDIASRAGLSPAGVYVHFSSKEELLHALSAQGHGQALAVVRDAAATTGSPADRLAAVMRAFSAWHAEHHAVASVVQYEFPHLTPEHRDEVLGLRKAIDEVVRDLLREGRADGSMTVDDVRDTALALMSMCIDVARWYSPHIARTSAQIGETYAALGLRLVAAGSAGHGVPPDPAVRRPVTPPLP